MIHVSNGKNDICIVKNIQVDFVIVPPACSVVQNDSEFILRNNNYNYIQRYLQAQILAFS